MSSPPSNVPPLQEKMKKVLFTTYRKIFFIAKKVDKSIPMRCCIACSPSRVYDGRKEMWEPLEVAKVCQWPQSRVFLDSLIRRLNGQRQFFFPLPLVVPSTPCESEKVLSSVDLSHSSDTPTGEALREGSSFPRSTEGEEPHQRCVSSKIAEPISHHFTFSGKEQQEFLSIPSFITSESTIAETARALFERTPFSMHNLNNAFAAVKELTFLSRHPLHNPSHFISPRLRELQTKVFFSASTSLPTFSHCTSKSSSSTPLFRQLAEDVRRHLDAESAAARQNSSQRSEKNKTKSSATNNCEASASTNSSTSSALHSEGRSGTVSEAKEDQEHTTEKDSSSCSPSHSQCIRAETSNDAELSAGISSVASNTEVNLLASHPQLRGYFRHSVMLVVQHNSHSTVAIVLNKVLLSEHKYIMPLRSVVRLIKTHDIFSVHLKDHSVMLGGPVMTSSTERSLTLLHRVPNVQDACQVGRANLWLNGNYDDLKAKLDRKEASSDDIAVLCGFAGWGSQQLDGEISLGTWIVARSASSSFNGGNEPSSSAAVLDETEVEKKPSESSEIHTKKLIFDTRSGTQGSSESNAEALGKYIFELIKTSSQQVSLSTMSAELSSLANHPASAEQSAASGDAPDHERSGSIFLKPEGLSSTAAPDLLLGTVGEESDEEEEHTGENSFVGGRSSISAEERIPLGGAAAWASLFQTFSGKMKEACYI